MPSPNRSRPKFNAVVNRIPPTGPHVPAAYNIKHLGKVVETHYVLKDAERAFWILTAHELKNGRVANLELDNRSSDCITPPDQLPYPLPVWAKDELRKVGLL